MKKKNQNHCNLFQSTCAKTLFINRYNNALTLLNFFCYNDDSFIFNLQNFNKDKEHEIPIEFDRILRKINMEKHEQS